MAASQAETSRFAPTGAFIVMALVLTGFAIMWDSPYDQFQGEDFGSGLLVIVMLAIAQVAVMTPTVIIVSRLRVRIARIFGTSSGTGWLALIVGSLLTLTGAIMGPSLFSWIGSLSATDLSDRQPLLLAYLLVPLVGVLLLIWTARDALKTSGQAQQASSRE